MELTSLMKFSKFIKPNFQAIFFVFKKIQTYKLKSAIYYLGVNLNFFIVIPVWSQTGREASRIVYRLFDELKSPTIGTQPEPVRVCVEHCGSMEIEVELQIQGPFKISVND